MIKPVGANDLRRNLLSKGFEEQRKRDHYFFVMYVGEQKTAFWMKLSHGAREIRRDEIKANARGLKISGDDLYRIACCEADREETLAIHERAGR